MSSKWIITTLGSLFAISILANGVLLYHLVKKVQEPVGAVVTETDPEAAPEAIAVQAELRLVKMMLGQWEGTVMTLGPVGEEITIRGRLAWDRDRQQGFVSLQGLHPQETYPHYHLYLIDERNERVLAARLERDSYGKAEQAFSASRRILKLKGAELSGIDAAGGEERLAAARIITP